MSATEIYRLTASDLIQIFRQKELSVTQVAQAFLERTKKLEPTVHAWASYDEAYILEQSQRLDKEEPYGRLYGVPIGIKDVFNTYFYPTAKGSPAWNNYKAGNDARSVSYLRNEGAIIFGKTDTAELAVHANHKVRNPYDLSKVTGSSSGGSAAAVATAMVPLALGTQTGGSTIRPASWCGVYAMKPSFGLIPRTGVLKTTDTLDTIGFFARSNKDLQLLWESLRIRGDNFPLQEKKLEAFRKGIPKKWRVGIVLSHLWSQTETYVKRALENLEQQLSLLEEVEVEFISLPSSTVHFQALHRRIYHPCLRYYLKNEWMKSPSEMSEVLQNIFRDADTIPPDDFALALKEQAELAQDLENFFVQHDFDILLSNASNGSASDKEPDSHSDLNQLWTMAWLPVISVPLFQCPELRPFGLQVVGRKFSDPKLFAFIEKMQQAGIFPSLSRIAGET